VGNKLSASIDIDNRLLIRISLAKRH
jgi:hypothetical protein